MTEEKNTDTTEEAPAPPVERSLFFFAAIVLAWPLGYVLGNLFSLFVIGSPGFFTLMFVITTLLDATSVARLTKWADHFHEKTPIARAFGAALFSIASTTVLAIGVYVVLYLLTR